MARSGEKPIRLREVNNSLFGGRVLQGYGTSPGIGEPRNTADVFVALSFSKDLNIVPPAEPLRPGDIAVFEETVLAGCVGKIVGGEIDQSRLPVAAAFRQIDRPAA